MVSPGSPSFLLVQACCDVLDSLLLCFLPPFDDCALSMLVSLDTGFFMPEGSFKSQACWTHFPLQLGERYSIVVWVSLQSFGTMMDENMHLVSKIDLATLRMQCSKTQIAT
jgi:hypothetical protein